MATIRVVVVSRRDGEERHELSGTTQLMDWLRRRGIPGTVLAPSWVPTALAFPLRFAWREWWYQIDRVPSADEHKAMREKNPAAGQNQDLSQLREALDIAARKLAATADLLTQRHEKVADYMADLLAGIQKARDDIPGG